MQKVYFRTWGHMVHCTGRPGSATLDRCPLSGTTPPQTVCSTTGRLSCRDRRHRETQREREVVICGGGCDGG